MELLFGLDVGTTNIKCVAYATTGIAVAQASCPTPTMPEGLRRAHHDPEILWRTVVGVIREVLAFLPSATEVIGLAVASIGEAGVPLDRYGEPLYPIIAWYDERTAAQSAWWAQAMGEREVYRHTGLPLGHTFTMNKLLWLRENEPSIYRRLSRWLCVSDYVAYRLSGEQAMGYSLASRTMALELDARRWSSDMLACGEIAETVFPPLRAEGAPVGHVTPAAARETGLLSGTPVYVGGHDHVCGALAMGAFEPGVVLDSTGTTEAELMTLMEVREYLAQGDLSFCLGCHVAPGRYYVIGSILGAGSMVSWLARLLWPSGGSSGRDSLDDLTEAAACSPPGSKGLYVLPHLAGAGSPERDSTARGVLVGLGLEHTRADVARATLEGLAYELRFLWQALERFTAQPIIRVVSVGGGARNRLWGQIKADVTARTLHMPHHWEAVSLGAAMLVGLGSGIYHDQEDAISRMGTEWSCMEPQHDAVQDYERLYGLFIERIRPLAAELGRISGDQRMHQGI